MKDDRAITPVFEDDAIVIMLATNNSYALYAGVSIQSIIEQADRHKNYDIVVVHTDMKDEFKILLESMSQSNISIRVVNITPIFSCYEKDIFHVTEHFTKEAYYRFFIPAILKHYDKVLYLDCDTIALRDVADLYETDIGENWWGVLYEPLHMILNAKGCKKRYYQEFFLPYIENILKMSLSNYFQSGVMLWNIKSCIKDDVMQRLFVRLKEIKIPLFPDQDVMNSLSNGQHIYSLSPQWNVCWYLVEYVDSCEMKKIFSEYGWDIDYLLENPFILHYCTNVKPLTYPNRVYAHHFWSFAEKSPFYDLILEKLISRIGMYERKVKRYKLLQMMTFGIVKKFARRLSYYQEMLQDIKENKIGIKA